jgi:hypothetical protein
MNYCIARDARYAARALADVSATAHFRAAVMNRKAAYYAKNYAAVVANVNAANDAGETMTATRARYVAVAKSKAAYYAIAAAGADRTAAAAQQIAIDADAAAVVASNAIAKGGA